MVFIVLSSVYSQVLRGPDEDDQHHQRVVSAENDLRADGVHEPRLAHRVREIPAVVDQVNGFRYLEKMH